jgi:hypothetical protein
MFIPYDIISMIFIIISIKYGYRGQNLSIATIDNIGAYNIENASHLLTMMILML